MTGLPEGCPLSCAGMVTIDLMWHLYNKAFAGMTKAVSYVDNLELCDSCPGRVLHALQVTREFCSILDIELDEKRLFAWSTSASHRLWLREQGLPLAAQSRDLGGQMNYTGKKHVQVLVQRLKSLDPLFKRLQRARLSSWQKRRCVQGALLPRGLHGSENIAIADGHLTSFRAKIMRALHWNRAGSSPLIRLGLLHTQALDPGYYQLWRSIWQLHRHCMTSQVVRDRWSSFIRQHASEPHHGPFGKLLIEFARLGWHLDSNLRLHLGGQLSLDFLSTAEEDLKFLTTYFWQQWVSHQLRDRMGYEDLEGIDVSHFDSIDGKVDSAQKESLELIRDGTFFTKDFLSKLDPNKTPLCDFCGHCDSREHKYLVCPKYSVFRVKYPQIFDEWDNLPTSLKWYGIPSANTYQLQRWHALLRLHDEPQHWHVPCPETPTLQIFTDGSCFLGDQPNLATAAWAFVCPDLDCCVASGLLPGISQSSARAETFCILTVLQWSVAYIGTLHIWCDNQSVVECFRTIQSDSAAPNDFANADLWRQIADLLRRSTADLYIHKVAAHCIAEQTSSPLEEWLAYWNGAADLAAKTANANRPAWIQTPLQLHREEWHQTHNLLRALSEFQLEVARSDLQSGEGDNWIDHDEEEPAVACSTATSPSIDPWFTDGIESLPMNWMITHCQRDEFGLNAFQKITNWMIALEASADFTARVSVVEIYVSFCIDHKVPFKQLCSEGSFNPYVQLTFAADLRLFRRCLNAIITLFPNSPEKIYCALAETGIHCGLSGFEIGWQSERHRIVRDALTCFVGQRPIKNSQGFSRPWRLT